MSAATSRNGVRRKRVVVVDFCTTQLVSVCRLNLVVRFVIRLRYKQVLSTATCRSSGATVVRRTYYTRVDNSDRTSTNTLTRFVITCVYSIVRWLACKNGGR